ncbi:MAG: radical SAM protein [Candidatus Omnitrophota bacterium]
MYSIYLESYGNGNLLKVIEKTFKLLESCVICPRKCKINRLKPATENSAGRGEKGFCKTALLPKVFSYTQHYGEEPPISGQNGSGTIFFSECNMRCLYCQNYKFSQAGLGKEVETEELANYMLRLQDLGCHNINFVTPTHILPQILKALYIAIPKGLKIPLCYNTSGYELPEIIKLLDGIIDIYLPDMRYSDNESAIKYSSAPDYPLYNQHSIKEMHRQVGIAQIDKNGIIKRGMIIRHLVLPSKISGTKKIMKFIAEELSKETYISLMSQYFPCHKVKGTDPLGRRITIEEYEEAQDIMHKYGLHNGWIQEPDGLEKFAGINMKQNL